MQGWGLSAAVKAKVENDNNLYDSITVNRYQELGKLQDSVSEDQESGWFKSTQRYDDLAASAEDNTMEGTIARNAQSYDDWQTFTDGLMWFDSIGCMAADSINNVIFLGKDRECYKGGTEYLTDTIASLE